MKKNGFHNFFLGFTVLVALSLQGCDSSKKFTKKDVNACAEAPIITTYRSMGVFNDAYFDIKKSNYFEFYRLLLDSVKNTSFKGKFMQVGDTLTLYFQDKKGEAYLGKKALLNPYKKEVIFFDSVVTAKNLLQF